MASAWAGSARVSGGLYQDVLSLRPVGRERTGVVQQVEGQEGGRPLAVGWELRDGDVPIPTLQRLDPLALVDGEVGGIEQAAEFPYMRGHGRADDTPIEGIRTARRHGLQGERQTRLRQPGTGLRLPVDVLPLAPTGLDRLPRPDPGGSGRGERKPVGGIGDRRLCKLGEGPGAEPFEEREPGVDRTGHSDGERTAAGHARNL